MANLSPEQIADLQRRREEEILAAQLAASIGSQLKEINSMSVSRTPISKARPLDPRSFIKTAAPGAGVRTRPQQQPLQNVQIPVQGEDALAPRAPAGLMIPMPKDVKIDPRELLPPEMIKQPVATPDNIPNPGQQLVVPEDPAPKAGQLELAFRQNNVDDIYSQLESLNSKVDMILSLLKKIESNAISTKTIAGGITDESAAGTDKKKS